MISLSPKMASIDWQLASSSIKWTLMATSENWSTTEQYRSYRGSNSSVSLKGLPVITQSLKEVSVVASKICL
jgi:hypothetical protein